MTTAVGLVGVTDSGKTYTALAALAGPGFAVLAGPTGLRVGEKGLGWTPAKGKESFAFERPTLASYEEALPKLAAAGRKRVLVDEASFATKNTYADLKVRFPGRKNTAERYEQLEAAVTRVFLAACRAGLDLVVFTFHLKEGRFDKERGVYLPGGPDLKGWEARKPLVQGLDDLLVTRHDPAGFPFPAQFFCPGIADPHWVTKGRSDVLHIARPTGPANLREYLRACGDPLLPRLPGLEWQETAAQRCCDRILAGEDQRAVYADLGQKLRERLPQAKLQWIRWALWDGCCRAQYIQGPDILSLPAAAASTDALAALAEVAPPADAAKAPTGAAGTTAAGSPSAGSADDDDEDED